MREDVDVSDVVDDFSDTYSMRREQPGAYVKGVYTPGEPTETTIFAAIFQPTAAALLRLEVGDRTNIAYSIWSTSRIYDGRTDDGRRGDLVNVNGNWYRVTNVSDRPEGGYYKGLLERYDARGRSVSTPSDVDA